jgi:hypothetical protein
VARNWEDKHHHSYLLLFGTFPLPSYKLGLELTTFISLSLSQSFHIWIRFADSQMYAFKVLIASFDRDICKHMLSFYKNDFFFLFFFTEIYFKLLQLVTNVISELRSFSFHLNWKLSN